MSDLSELVGLEKHYTNHSIRVTGVTGLTRGHYTPRQIMSITGHKSIQSLGIYQRVRKNKKMMMGMSLMYSLLRPSNVQRVIRENKPVFEIEGGDVDPLNMAIPAILTAPTTNQLGKNIDSNVEIPIPISAAQSEKAIVPFVSKKKEANTPENNFDILELLSDCADADLK